MRKELFLGERETLAIIWAVTKFHRYLYGQHFILESDHRSLQYLRTSHSKNPRIMRWSLALEPYDFTVRFTIAYSYFLITVNINDMHIQFIST